MNTESDLVTVEEAAAVLGVHVSNVRRRLMAGELAGRNVAGRVWLIPRSALDAAPRGPKRRGPAPKKDRDRPR